eukprot:scaffold4469_cov193-Prasinococcus_capsulatus_cf.AAC.1
MGPTRGASQRMQGSAGSVSACCVESSQRQMAGWDRGCVLGASLPVFRYQIRNRESMGQQMKPTGIGPSPTNDRFPSS